MRLLVRTWNLFHGRTLPESGRTELEGMVRLVTADAPDVVCLQEVPVWALRQLPGWSAMSAFGAVTTSGWAAYMGPLSLRAARAQPH